MKKFVFCFLAVFLVSICTAQDKLTNFKDRQSYSSVRLYQQDDHLYFFKDSLYEVVDENVKGIDIGYDFSQLKIYDYEIELNKLIIVLSCKVFIYDIESKESTFIDTSPIQYKSYEYNCLHYFNEKDEFVSHYIDLVGYEINNSIYKYWRGAFNNYLGMTEIDELYYLDDIKANQLYLLGDYGYLAKYLEEYDKLYYIDSKKSLISFDLVNTTLDTLSYDVDNRLYLISNQLIISREISYGVSEISLFDPGEYDFIYRDTFQFGYYEPDYIYYLDTTGLLIYVDRTTLSILKNGEVIKEIHGDFIKNNTFSNKIFFTTYESQGLIYYTYYDINLNSIDTINKNNQISSFYCFKDINNNFYTTLSEFYHTPSIFTGNKNEFPKPINFDLDYFFINEPKEILNAEPNILLFDSRGVYTVESSDTLINRFENYDNSIRFSRWEKAVYYVEETLLDSLVKSYSVIKYNPDSGQKKIVFEIGQKNIVDNIKYNCYAIGKSKIQITSNESDSTIYCDLDSGEKNIVDKSNFKLIGIKDDFIYYEDTGTIFKQHKFSEDTFEKLKIAPYKIEKLIGNYIQISRNTPNIFKHKIININDFKVSELITEGLGAVVLYAENDLFIYGNTSKLHLFDGNDSKKLITFNSTKSFSDISSIISVKGNILIYIKDQNTDLYKLLIYDKESRDFLFDESKLVNKITPLTIVNDRNIGLEKNISTNKNYLVDYDDQANRISIISELDIKGTLSFFAQKENILFFKYSHDETGEELALYDTNTDDFNIIDLNPGHQSSSPDDYLFEGNYFYFYAKYKNEGYQIWKFDLNGLLNSDDTIIVKPNQFKIYPNPTTGIISFENKSSVKILNSSGQIVLEANDTRRIDLGHLRSGCYFIINNEGKSIRIIKI